MKRFFNAVDIYLCGQPIPFSPVPATHTSYHDLDGIYAKLMLGNTYFMESKLVVRGGRRGSGRVEELILQTNEGQHRRRLATIKNYIQQGSSYMKLKRCHGYLLMEVKSKESQSQEIERRGANILQTMLLSAVKAAPRHTQRSKMIL